jgi:hypothetical protein
VGDHGLGAKSGLCVTSDCSVLKTLDNNPGCSPASGTFGDAACAIVNQAVLYPSCPATATCIAGNTIPTPSPWLFTEKDGTSNAFQAGDYFEGGLNLTALGLQNECTSSFLMNTRSSQSVDSALQDFALGQVGSCSSKISTTASLNGTEATINNSNTAANGTVSSGTDTATVTVTGISPWSGTVDFYLCGPIASGTCNSGGVKLNGTVNNVGVPVSNSSGRSAPARRPSRRPAAIAGSVSSRRTGEPPRGVFRERPTRAHPYPRRP